MKIIASYTFAFLLTCSIFSCQSDQKPTQATGQDSGTNTIDGSKSQSQDASADSAIAPGRGEEDKGTK